MNQLRHKQNITAQERAIRTAFNRHKNRCDSKKFDRLGNNVKFLLSFDEWWAIWQASGKFAQRGRRKGDYVMSRVNDVGHYELGNVFIQTHSKNVADANTLYSQIRRAAKANIAAQP